MGTLQLIQLGVQVGMMALQASKHIEGPRVTDLKVTKGDYGAPWPRVWGTRWLRPPVIWAQDLKEVKQTRKTKGGKYNDYTYFGYWAHGLAIHELAAVRRIKADGHLIYDASGAGPVTPFTLNGDGGGKSGGGGGSTIADYMRFVPGNFTQDPDPAIMADVEAKNGEGSCPAYRGRSLLVFDGVPLEKFGNRIPQIEVEVVGVATPHYPFETFTTTENGLSHLTGATFSPDYSRFMWVNGTRLEIWDVAARARMIGATLTTALSDSGPLGLYNSGEFLAVDSSNTIVYRFSADGTTRTTLFTAPSPGVAQPGGVRVVQDAGGTEHWCTLCFSSVTGFAFDGALFDFATLTGAGAARVTDCFADADGSIWVAGTRGVIGNTVALFYRMLAAPDASGPGLITVTGLPASGGQITDVAAVHYGAPGYDQFVFAYAGGLYAAARATGTVLYSNTGSGAVDGYNVDNQFHAMPPGAHSIWLGAIGAKEISLADLSVIRTLVLNNWTAQSADGIIYDRVNHALITAPSTGTAITWRYLDRIGATEVQLGDVVRDVAVLAGIDGAEIDVSALTQLVPGYDVSGGSGKDWIGPLLDLYDIDPRPHGFVLEFLPRGAASDETIASTAFATSAAHDAALFTATPETGATDLPRQVTMQFADTAIEQQPATAMSPPLFNGGSQRSQSLDMSNLALGADTARQLVARFARRQRFDARGYALALPLSRIDLEPGAVKVLDLAGVAVTARLQSMVLDADRRIATEWKADAPSVALLDGAAGASADGHAAAEIVVPLLSKGFDLDLPLLRDLDESASPVIYPLAAPYAAGAWPGATMLRAQSGEYSDEIAAIDSSAAASWGYAATALGAPGSPWLWDRGQTVQVVLQIGSLTGTTEAAIDAGGEINLALLGGELIQFASAVLTAPLTYTLSGLKRGRRGTEWACASHTAGETFVLLNTAAAVARPLSEVGTEQSFKAVTNGRTEAGAFPIALTPFSGASKKPYAPTRLLAAKDSASGDWALRWTRRTRIGGAWTSGTPIPLGEASEAYVVEIMNGGAVVRTITGLSSAAAAWTSAQQVTDFGSSQSAISWRVYQISDSVGRGFAAAA